MMHTQDEQNSLPFEAMLAALPIEGEDPLPEAEARALYAKAMAQAGLAAGMAVRAGDTGAASVEAGAPVFSVYEGADGPTAVLAYPTADARKKAAARRRARMLTGLAAVLTIGCAALALRAVTTGRFDFALGGSTAAADNAAPEDIALYGLELSDEESAPVELSPADGSRTGAAEDAAPKEDGGATANGAQDTDSPPEGSADVTEDAPMGIGVFSGEGGMKVDIPEDGLISNVVYEVVQDSRPLTLPTGAQPLALAYTASTVEVDFMLEQAVYTLYCTPLSADDGQKDAAGGDASGPDGGVLVVVVQPDGSRITYWIMADWRFQLESADADDTAFTAAASAISFAAP